MNRYRPPSTPVFEGLVDDLAGTLERGAHGYSTGLNIGSGLFDVWSLATDAPSAGEPPPGPSAAWLYAAYAGTAVVHQPILSTDPKIICEELGLNARLTCDQVSTLRRQFAVRNHPDILAEEFRVIATQRMMIANALCDSFPVVLARKPKS